MNGAFRIVLLVALAAGLFYGFHRLTDPAPIPTLPALVGGMLAILWRARWPWLVGATLLGLGGGAGIHARSHFVEGRVDSTSQLLAHVAGDAAVGLAGALVIIAFVLAVDRQFLSQAKVVVLLGLAFLSGCSITPPAVSTAADDPSNPYAAESTTRPLRPTLMAGAGNFLPAETGATKATSEQLQALHPAGYTCSMHPEIQSDKPGACPKCGMTLVTRASLEKEKP